MQKTGKMARHNELGKEGEEEASAYLRDKGYTILHRNWHAGRKELDIVAEKNGELVIVEVKTRSNEEFGHPEDAVTPRKIRNIIVSADAYIQQFAIDLPVRFDLITIVGAHPPFEIEHIEGAFLPPVW